MRKAALVYTTIALLTIGVAQADLFHDTRASHHEKSPLYALLAAELALHREHPQIALDYYLIASTLTDNPEVAQQATELAIDLQDTEAAFRSVKRWTTVAPDSLSAQLVAASLFISQNTRDTLPFLISALRLDPPHFHEHISFLHQKLTLEQQKRLQNALSQIARNRPRNAYAYLAAAQGAALQADRVSAHRFLTVALKHQPDLTPALALQARLIRAAESNDEGALRYLSEKVTAFPENGELRLFYAYALMDAQKTETAQQELEILTTHPTHREAALSALGELHFARQEFAQAARLFLKSLQIAAQEDTPHSETAKYFLAQIAEQKNHATEAIQWYLSLPSHSQYHIPAILKAAALLAERGDTQHAIEVLHAGVPSVWEEYKQLFLTELDILVGSQHFEQAFKLVEDLLQTFPEDPDFLWVHTALTKKVPQVEAVR